MARKSLPKSARVTFLHISIVGIQGDRAHDLLPENNFIQENRVEHQHKKKNNESMMFKNMFILTQVPKLPSGKQLWKTGKSTI